MQTRTQRDEPAKRPQRPAEHGAPGTYAAQAMRKNLSVRVTIGQRPPEPEETGEHGYGHGV